MEAGNLDYYRRRVIEELKAEEPDLALAATILGIYRHAAIQSEKEEGA